MNIARASNKLSYTWGGNTEMYAGSNNDTVSHKLRLFVLQYCSDVVLYYFSTVVMYSGVVMCGVAL